LGAALNPRYAWRERVAGPHGWPVARYCAVMTVPLPELRRLRAVARHASPEGLDEAEIEATLTAHDEWVAAGCLGALSHEEVMAELLGSDR
jgi:hypothetical protein